MSQSYYIYPARKRVEIYSALFAGGFGVNIWSLGFTSEPLKWAPSGQTVAGQRTSSTDQSASF